MALPTRAANTAYAASDSSVTDALDTPHTKLFVPTRPRIPFPATLTGRRPMYICPLLPTVPTRHTMYTKPTHTAHTRTTPMYKHPYPDNPNPFARSTDALALPPPARPPPWRRRARGRTAGSLGRWLSPTVAPPTAATIPPDQADASDRRDPRIPGALSREAPTPPPPAL